MHVLKIISYFIVSYVITNSPIYYYVTFHDVINSLMKFGILHTKALAIYYLHIVFFFQLTLKQFHNDIYTAI